MKKLLTVLLILITSTTLSACGKKAEFKRIKKNSSTTELAISTTTQEVTEKDKLDKLKKQYAAVFEDYQLIDDYSQKSGDNKEALAAKVGEFLKTDIAYWTVISLLQGLNDVTYSFVDLDQNGTSEMVVAEEGTDKQRYIIGVYYLHGEVPTLLGQGLVAGVGGSRSTVQIYTDGKVLSLAWSSGTGEGTGTLYELQNQGVEAKVFVEKDIQMGTGDLSSQFGYTTSDLLDLERLDWQHFTFSNSPAEKEEGASSLTQMNLDAVLTGDLPSINGTWTSKSGTSFRIDGKTFTAITDGAETAYTISNIRRQEGKVVWALAEVMASPPAYVLVPIGTPISTQLRTYSSNESRERIYLLPQYDAPQEDYERNIYYPCCKMKCNTKDKFV